MLVGTANLVAQLLMSLWLLDSSGWCNRPKHQIQRYTRFVCCEWKYWTVDHLTALLFLVLSVKWVSEINRIDWMIYCHTFLTYSAFKNRYKSKNLRLAHSLQSFSVAPAVSDFIVTVAYSCREITGVPLCFLTHCTTLGSAGTSCSVKGSKEHLSPVFRGLLNFDIWAFSATCYTHKKKEIKSLRVHWGSFITATVGHYV